MTSRSATTTLAPFAANNRAMAKPIPDAAPVISATLPASALGSGRRSTLSCSNCQYSTENLSDSLTGWYFDTPSAPRITLMALT